jgi:chromosome segregation ATPase
MGLREAAILLGLYLIREKRRRNYEEWHDRMESNISRWENSLDKLESARTRCSTNLAKNKERLKKSEDFYEKITTGKSKEWYEHTNFILTNISNIQKEEILRAKINEHENSISSVINQIARLKTWIKEDRDRISDINSKISDIEHKIWDVKNKL